MGGNMIDKEKIAEKSKAVFLTNELNARAKQFMAEIRAGKYDIPRYKGVTKCKSTRQAGQ